MYRVPVQIFPNLSDYFYRNEKDDTEKQLFSAVRAFYVSKMGRIFKIL
jgi:hypothetical protein